MGKPHSGSINDRISRLDVGERTYIDTDLEGYLGVQRRVATRSRRPETMVGMEFSCQLFTAVSASKAGDVRYLVCVERVQ